MWYEINVAQDGQHLFATHERSLTHISQVAPLVERLQWAFPPDEGYDITVSRMETSGMNIPLTDLQREYERWTRQGQPS